MSPVHHQFHSSPHHSSNYTIACSACACPCRSPRRLLRGSRRTGLWLSAPYCTAYCGPVAHEGIHHLRTSLRMNCESLQYAGYLDRFVLSLGTARGDPSFFSLFLYLDFRHWVWAGSSAHFHKWWRTRHCQDLTPGLPGAWSEAYNARPYCLVYCNWRGLYFLNSIFYYFLSPLPKNYNK